MCFTFGKGAFTVFKQWGQSAMHIYAGHLELAEGARVGTTSPSVAGDCMLQMNDESISYKQNNTGLALQRKLILACA